MLPEVLYQNYEEQGKKERGVNRSEKVEGRKEEETKD
jgi:hypothetical protein